MPDKLLKGFSLTGAFIAAATAFSESQTISYDDPGGMIDRGLLSTIMFSLISLTALGGRFLFGLMDRDSGEDINPLCDLDDETFGWDLHEIHMFAPHARTQNARTLEAHKKMLFFGDCGKLRIYTPPSPEMYS